jgi:hypothetical protein
MIMAGPDVEMLAPHFVSGPVAVKVWAQAMNDLYQTVPSLAFRAHEMAGMGAFSPSPRPSGGG